MARRLVGLSIVFFGITLFVFLVSRLAPGDPVQLMLGPDATPEQMQIIRRDLGLDESLAVQYGRWLGNLLQGKLGQSIGTGLDVSEMILERLFPTIELTVAAMVIALFLGIPLGVLSAVRQYSLIDYLSTLVSMFFVSMPSFWLGLMLILGVSLYLGVLPPSGYVSPLESLSGNLSHLILPAVTLGLYESAWIIRLTRSNMLEVLRKEYVTTARAKGVPEWKVIFKHTLKNALISLLTMIGLQMGYLLGGVVVVETIFAWPGIGRLLVENGIYQRDFPVIQGVTLTVAVFFVLVNLTVDVAYRLVDPRVRVGARQ